ncbi:DUF3013 family protein [Streptococcus jiangjianxini]|uniref:DUF3013 family protein n=1 Tax=Streptococcus jiangjianxini TaxID=3161189 RepID=UPI0032EAF25D
MAKFGFLSVLEEALEKHLDVDFAIDWDKKNHAVEVVVVLEAQNKSEVEVIDDAAEVSNDDIVFEDFVLFYNPAKTKFDPEDYLVAIPYEPKKGLSREFLGYFAKTLNDVTMEGISDLMDFLQDDSIPEFALKWDDNAFEKGRAELVETERYGYPRY